MEVIGSVAAVLQLVQAVGKTVIQVSQVYHDIRDMDDALRDFDNQLGATRMMLSVLSDGIQRTTLGPSTPPWWNQDVLEGLLNSCNRSYSRLGTIFSNISRQMSSSTALGAYIKKRRYDSDISLLRHSIDTYTSALQLPVLIQTIQGCSTATIPQPPSGDIAASFDELMRRIDSLQSSMDRLDHDLVTRALRTPETPMPASPQSKSSQNIQAGLDAAERKEKIDMENDTRATLDVLKGLVGHAKDYASTIESVSISSKLTRSSSKTVRAFEDIVRVATDPEPHTNEVVNPDVGFHVHFSTKSRQDVADWADNVDLAEGTSATSTSRTSSPPSVTTIIQSVSSGITNETSVLVELHERRIQEAEKCMKNKIYDKAISHLERLLSSSSDPEFPQDESRSAQSLAKALIHSQSDESTVEGYCRKFPSISVWVDEYRLEQALGLLEKGRNDEVVTFLQSYKMIPESTTPTQPASSKTIQKIQLTLCQALHQSSRGPAKDESIPILEQLLRQDSLESAVKGDAHSLLAETYHVKGNFENAKSHGIQACQIKRDTLGRDHDETKSCITFMVDLCFENDDPDDELWRGMLSRPDYTHDGVPPKLSDIQNRLHSCIQEMQRLAVTDPKGAAKYGVKYLKENYCPILSQGMPYPKIQRDWAPVTRECLSEFFEAPLLCWDCLRKHMEKTHTLAAVKAGAGCFRHASESSGRFTGLSPFHFFAMAVPRRTKWPARQKEDCVEEMDAILKIAMMANPGAQITSRLINAVMNYESAHKEVSALWLAATHENQGVVDFLLSLGETDATRGMGILSKTKYGYEFRRKTYSILSLLRGVTNSGCLASSRMRSKPFLRAFAALSSDEARQVLKATGSGIWPWWFSCPHMLDRFLIKCGEGRSQATRDMPSSLLRFLLQSVSDRAFKDIKLVLEPADIKKVFWTLWDHGAKQSELFFMMQPIKNTTANYSYYSESYIAGRLQLWFSILNQLRELNVTFDATSRTTLEGCCKRLMVLIRKVRSRSEKFATRDAETSFRQRFDKVIENARQSSGSSRAQNMWEMESGDANDSGRELAGSLDLFWNFLDPEPTSSPVDSAIPDPQPSTETLTQVISADNLAAEQPIHSQAG